MWVLVPHLPSVVVRVPLPQRKTTPAEIPKMSERKFPNPQGTAFGPGWKRFLMSLLLVPTGEEPASPCYLGRQLRAL